MNGMQMYLSEILGRSEVFQDATYIGRACYLRAADGVKIKAEFISSHIANQYDAILLSAINPREGVVDKLTLRFRDYFSPRVGSTAGTYVPHVWDEGKKISWYGMPHAHEFDQIAEAAEDYANLYRQTESEDMTMGM